MKKEKEQIRNKMLQLMIDEYGEDNVGVKPFTCDECFDVDNCPFAFDLYNTNNDCIAEK